MRELLPILLCAASGAASCIQSASNGILGRSAGLRFAVLLNAILVLCGALAFWRLGPRPAAAASYPANPLLYVGGVYGVFIVVSAAWAFPRLGAGPATALMVAAQLVTSLVLDHFGVPGGRIPIDLTRLLGVVLLGAGALLVLWPKLRA